jgi:8-oxo-dGTP pyrophosphatase MutT (NUDIX family)
MKIILKILYQASRFLLLLFKPVTNGVRVLLVRDGQVLLVKHIYEDRWYLPGGLVERGETLDQATRREVMEEVGASLDDLQLFGAYSNFEEGRNDHIIVFISQEFNLNGQSDHEIEAIAFYPFDKLPEKISSGSKKRIDDFLQGGATRYGLW